MPRTATTPVDSAVPGSRGPARKRKGQPKTRAALEKRVSGKMPKAMASYCGGMGEATANRLRTRLRRRTDPHPSIRIVQRRLKPRVLVPTACEIRRPTGWQGFEADPSPVPELLFYLGQSPRD